MEKCLKVGKLKSIIVIRVVFIRRKIVVSFACTDQIGCTKEHTWSSVIIACFLYPFIKVLILLWD